MRKININDTKKTQNVEGNVVTILIRETIVASHDYGKFIRVFLEKLHQNGVLNEVLEFGNQIQKPKPVSQVRARRRSKKTDV